MRDAIAQCVRSMILDGASRQPDKSHVSHATIEGVQGCYSERFTLGEGGVSGRPALRLANNEIPERLHARHRLQFLGIHKICIELD